MYNIHYTVLGKFIKLQIACVFNIISTSIQSDEPTTSISY